MKRLLSPVAALAVGCGLAGPLAAQTAPLETCRRSAYDRYASNQPTVDVTAAGIDHQNNRVFRWTATWSSGKAFGSCLVNAQGQVARFDVVSTSNQGGPAQPPPEVVKPAPVTPTRVTCESKEARRNECAIPTNSRARLVRTMSTNPCIENRSWGTTEQVLWVTAGCRGEFEITARPTTGPGYGGSSTRRITCGSPVGNQVECKTSGYATSVRIVRDLSGRCRQSSNWGYTDSFIWTNGGCRAEFEVGYRGGHGLKPVAGTRTITCGNSYGTPMSCNLFGKAATVRVSRDLSNGRCRQGQTWGFNQQDMWVKGGCYADFQVRYMAPMAR